MNSNSRIYVAGHRGLVGSAIKRALEARGYTNIITATRQEVDLREQQAVRQLFQHTRPEYVFLAAAKVGGIMANDRNPVDFLYDNLMLELNILHESAAHNVKKLLFLGTSCIYPKLAPQPIQELSLLTGPLEPTNEWYAIAKIAGIKMCQAYRKQRGLDFICGMPTNLYGPGDNYDLNTSHVLPALVRKVHEAKTGGRSSITLWGTGSPLREFLYVDDCADACLFLMARYSDALPINIGSPCETSIRDLAMLVGRVVDHPITLQFDLSKPDGTPRKKLDTARLTAMGWTAATTLEDGLRATYKAFTDAM